MPIRIDTKHTNYKRGLQRFRAFRNQMKPMIKRYYKLKPEQQERWLEKDVMMREFIEMCERVTKRQNDD